MISFVILIENSLNWKMKKPAGFYYKPGKRFIHYLPEGMN